MNQELQDELLLVIKRDLKDAIYSKQGWGENSIDFQDHCGCYSEYTTESCRLEVTVAGTLSENQYALRQLLDRTVRSWAESALSWIGCECCEENLYVDVRLYDIKNEPEAE